MRKLLFAAIGFAIVNCGATQTEDAANTKEIPNKVRYVAVGESSPARAAEIEPLLSLPDGRYKGKMCHENACKELVLEGGKIVAWRAWPHCRSHPARWAPITKGDGRIFVGSRSAAERILNGEVIENSSKQSDRVFEILNLRTVDDAIHFDTKSSVKRKCRGNVLKRGSGLF